VRVAHDKDVTTWRCVYSTADIGGGLRLRDRLRDEGAVVDRWLDVVARVVWSLAVDPSRGVLMLHVTMMVRIHGSETVHRMLWPVASAA